MLGLCATFSLRTVCHRNKHTHALAHACKHAHRHARKHARTRTDTHARTHARTRAHTHRSIRVFQRAARTLNSPTKLRRSVYVNVIYMHSDVGAHTTHPPIHPRTGGGTDVHVYAHIVHMHNRMSAHSTPPLTTHPHTLRTAARQNPMYRGRTEPRRTPSQQTRPTS